MAQKSIVHNNKAEKLLYLNLTNWLKKYCPINNQDNNNLFLFQMNSLIFQDPQEFHETLAFSDVFIKWIHVTLKNYPSD